MIVYALPDPACHVSLRGPGAEHFQKEKNRLQASIADRAIVHITSRRTHQTIRPPNHQTWTDGQTPTRRVGRARGGPPAGDLIGPVIYHVTPGLEFLRSVGYEDPRVKQLPAPRDAFNDAASCKQVRTESPPVWPGLWTLDFTMALERVTPILNRAKT